MRHLKKLFLVISVAYMCVVAGMYFAQRSLLYHPEQTLETPADAQLEMDNLFIASGDGTRINLWYKPASEGTPTIVHFHGNAGHLGLRHKKFRQIMREGFGLLAVSYRGYGASEGAPSEKGIFADAAATVEWLKDKGVSEKDMLFYGESLGTGVALKMATRYRPYAIMLEAPFTSVEDRASELHPYLPVPWVLKDKFLSHEFVKSITAPVMIVHKTKDHIIPFSHGRALEKMVPTQATFYAYEEEGHTNFNWPDVIAKLKRFSDAARP